jgi:trk system potassium uptake protein TrkA
MGTPRGVHELLYRFLRGSTHGYDAQEAVVVGGGSVGLSVARGLEAAGWSIRVIEESRERCEAISPTLRGLVIHGDGTDLDLLEQEHAADASVLVAVTNNDEKNLLVSLMGRTLGIPRVVTRADRLSNERLFERVGIDVVRSARGAAIRGVVHDIVDPSYAVRAELEHGDIHIVDLQLPEDFPTTPLWQMRTPLFAVVGAVVRGREVCIPHGRTELRAGDHLLVVTSLQDEDAARAHYLSPPPPESVDPDPA